MSSLSVLDLVFIGVFTVLAVAVVALLIVALRGDP